MTWVTIPNEPVKEFNGKPIKIARVNGDFEVIYKPIKCLGIDAGTKEPCPETFTLVSEWREHIADNHPDAPSDVEVKADVEMIDAKPTDLLLQLLTQFNDQRPQSPFNAFRKTLDGYHATEVWRRAWIASTNDSVVMRLKDAQQDWLKALLERRIPLTAEEKAAGATAEDRKTIAMLFYGLSEDNVRQAMLPLAERRPPEAADPDEPEDERPKLALVPNDVATAGTEEAVEVPSEDASRSDAPNGGESSGQTPQEPQASKEPV